MNIKDIRRSTGSIEGQWWDFTKGEKVDNPTANLCLRIAERDNPKHRDALARAQMQRIEALRSSNGASTAAWDAAQVQAMAESLLVGWENMEDDDGLPIPYSEAKAAELLCDPTMWPLRNFVQDASAQPARLVRELQEAAEGN